VQNDRRLRLVYQVIQKPERLGLGMERRQRLKLICVASFVGREKIDTKAALGLITRNLSLVQTRNRPERLIGSLQDIEHGRSAIFDTHGHRSELCNIDIAGLQR
jgi:hypothetical protein